MYKSHPIPRRFFARILVSIRLRMTCLHTLFWMCASIGPPVFAATDELGMNAAANPVTIHDLHAMILHLLGLDYEKLTYRHKPNAQCINVA